MKRLKGFLWHVWLRLRAWFDKAVTWMEKP